MQKQYPNTYDYIYSLLERNFSMQFDDLTTEQKENILGLFVEEADSEAMDAINSCEASMPKKLASNLINLSERNLLETKKLIAQHIWNNASYYIEEIFEYAQSKHEEELDEEPDYMEHWRADISERAKYANHVINQVFKF